MMLQRFGFEVTGSKQSNAGELRQWDYFWTPVIGDVRGRRDTVIFPFDGVQRNSQGIPRHIKIHLSARNFIDAESPS